MTLSFVGALSRGFQCHGKLLSGLFVAGASSTQLSWTEQAPVNTSSSSLRRRMTAIGHFSVLSETKFNPSIVTFVLTMSGAPFAASDFTRLWKEREMPDRHPRFHQTVSESKPGHFEPKPGSLDVDATVNAHVSETLSPANRADLVTRIALLQTERWSLSDSLWHAYVACLPKGGILLFRGHHALADGASMGAAFMDLTDEAEEFRREILNFLHQRRRRTQSLLERLNRSLYRLWWFLAGSCRALIYQLRLYLHALVDPNPWAILEAQAATTTPNRNISWTEVAPVSQIKWVAHTLTGPKATVNDVLVACVTAALAKQLAWHRHKREYASIDTKRDLLPVQSHMTVAVPVHLKGGVILPDESVSNQLGAFCVRVPGEVVAFTGPQQTVAERRLEMVHKQLYAIKQTPMAFLSHWLARSLTQSAQVLPTSLASWLFHKAGANAVAVVTNTRGSSKPVHIDGRRVESMYGFVPLPPGIPVGVVVGSYAGNMALTVTAQPWAVPDADQFLVWVLEEYLDLVHQAKQTTTE